MVFTVPGLGLVKPRSGGDHLLCALPEAVRVHQESAGFLGLLLPEEAGGAPAETGWGSDCAGIPFMATSKARDRHTPL